jgi:hypothetical protein
MDSVHKKLDRPAKYDDVADLRYNQVPSLSAYARSVGNFVRWLSYGKVLEHENQFVFFWNGGV